MITIARTGIRQVFANLPAQLVVRQDVVQPRTLHPVARLNTHPIESVVIRGGRTNRLVTGTVNRLRRDEAQIGCAPATDRYAIDVRPVRGRAVRAKVRTSIIGATIFEPDLKPSRRGERLLEALDRLQARGI